MPANQSASSRPPGKTWVKLLILGVFMVVLSAYFALGGPKYVSLDSVKIHRDELLAYTHDHFIAAMIMAFLVYAASTAFSLPGGLVLSLAVGMLFGRWVGTTLIVFAATLGATILFLAARYLFADAARKRLGTLGEKINRGFSKNAFTYLLFLRLVPAFPFFLVNLAPAFTSIPLRTYVIATFVGIIPGSFVFANLGLSLAHINSLSGLVSRETLTALLLLALFSLIPVGVGYFRGSKEPQS